MAQSEKDLKAVKLVIERFNRSEAYCQAWHDNGTKRYKQYRFYRDSGKYPYKHNVKDRLTFTMIEVMTAKIMQALFALQPFISIVPIGGEDVRISKQLEKVVDVLISNPEREFFLEFLLNSAYEYFIFHNQYLSVSSFNIVLSPPTYLNLHLMHRRFFLKF